MSRTTDRFRPPYSKRLVESPRQCVFAGTVNHSTYLRDDTGARRFWPITCGAIDIESLARHRDQLWAEAKVRFDAGGAWWLEIADLVAAANHHDEAYHWAERRKLETHPKTGAAQLVEVRETVQEIVVPKYVEAAQPAMPKPRLFADTSDEELLSYGVPPEWLADVRVANEDTLLAIAEDLPAEAAEALLNLATGTTPKMPVPAPVGADPFQHPDAQRRFRVMKNVEELQRALESPWEKWTVFLHPAQRQLVEKDCSGPARVSGSAGTGKTIVALHRAVHLAHTNPDARVLLATFSDSLANALKLKLRLLIGNEPRVRERLAHQSCRYYQ